MDKTAEEKFAEAKSAEAKAERDAATVLEIAAQAFVDAVESLAIIEILESGNGKGVNDAINKAEAGRTGAAIQRSLFTRLHILISRAYSNSPREGDLNAERAFYLLKDKAVQKEVQTDAESLKNVEAATSLWRKCRDDHRFERFMEFRDKQLVHFSETNPRIPDPIYREVFEFSRLTISAIEKLALGTGVVALTPESQMPEYKKDAKNFWKPWIAK